MYATVKETVPETSYEQFNGKRVLVVDDVELNREIAVAIIEDADYEWL